MTDTFDSWKFPETFDEDTADTFIKFADTFDEDADDYAIFPWQFEQTFEVSVESINASQTAVTGTMNGASTTFSESVSATIVATSATSNTGTLTSQSEPATTVSAPATTNSATVTDLYEKVDATPVSTASTMNATDIIQIEAVTASQFGASATTQTGVISTNYEPIVWKTDIDDIQKRDDIDGSVKLTSSFTANTITNIETSSNYVYGSHSENDEFYRVTQFSRGDLTENWTVERQSSSSVERAKVIKPVSDGVIISWTNEDVAKYDADGNKLWSVDPAANTQVDSITVTPNGDIYTYSNDENTFWVYDSNGNLIAQESGSNFGINSGNFSWMDAKSDDTVTISSVADGELLEVDNTLTELSSNDSANPGQVLIGVDQENEIHTFVPGNDTVKIVNPDLTVETVGQFTQSTSTHNDITNDGVGGYYYEGDSNDVYRVNSNLTTIFNVNSSLDELGTAPNAVVYPGEYQPTVSATASQATVLGSMNSTSFTEGFDATQVNASTTTQSGQVSMSLGTTQATGVAVSNNGSVTATSASATQFTADALMETGETFAVEQITATNASAPASMNTTGFSFRDTATATQPKVLASAKSPTVFIFKVVDATQPSVVAVMNATDTSFTRMRYQRLQEQNDATVGSTQNSAEITPTVNEVE